MVHYEDYKTSLGQMVLSASLGRAITNIGLIRRAIGYRDTLNRKSAEMLDDDFLDWLSSRDPKRPFFAFLNYFDAHGPLLPPAPFDRQFVPNRPDVLLDYNTNDIDYLVHRNWSESDVEKLRNAYDSSLTSLDHQIGVLFDKLSEKGLSDNTVVIITSDHGESLGEHGLVGHGTSLYIQTLRVPLLIRFPSRVPRGARVKQTVSLRDLPATVLDLIGAASQNVFPGESLGRYLGETAREPDLNEHHMILSELRHTSWMDPQDPASKGDMKSLVSEQYHYIHNGDGSEELFDRGADPEELQNLVSTAENQEVLEEFRSALKTADDLK